MNANTQMSSPVRLVVLIAVIALTLLGPMPAAQSQTAAPNSPRERIRIDAGWRFYKEPRPTAAVSDWGTPETTWKYAPADAASTPQRIDATAGGVTWTDYTVGRDAFSATAGYRMFRSTLPSASPAPVDIRFDSVKDLCWVWLNGTLLGANQGAELAFDVKTASAWKPGGPNVLDVLVQDLGPGPGGIMGTVLLQFGPPPTPAYAKPGYNDAGWRTVHLPHDYVVEGNFDPKADPTHGFLPVTTAWYRKALSVPSADRGKTVWIDFDGVYRDAWVWINGKFLGENKSGYSAFRYDISPYVNYGGKNEIAVHVDPTFFEGWWYEGGGIYRHVWLNVANPVHIAPDGTYVTTQVDQARRSAAVTVQTELENETRSTEHCLLVTEIKRPTGSLVGPVSTPVAIPAGAVVTVSQSMDEPRAQLWSPETPRMYGVHSTVMQSGRRIDAYDTPFGLRTIRFDVNSGFYLNGRHVLLKGMCNHQDSVAVGIGMPDGMLHWRIEKLKAMGCNAYRMSHNEAASDLLDDCDKLGMLVMDESRHFGDTYQPKTYPGTLCGDLSDFHQQLKRDRNHPSIVLWSIANEEWRMEKDPADSHRIGAAMRGLVRRMDPTRPTTCAGWGGLADSIDILGINYTIHVYKGYHKDHSKQPMLSSETSSEVGTRGEYIHDAANGWCSAYDTEDPQVTWGYSNEDCWSEIADNPFMAGSFSWTGFEYRGEPTPYKWPDVSSNMGVLDLCGFPKDGYYYYQSQWTSKPMVHILPHWNWPGKVGTPISVWAYSNQSRVELFLNGRSLGAQAAPAHRHAEWSVPYAPGTLVARAIDETGKVVATDTVATAGNPAAIRLTASKAQLEADGEDVVMVEADILDSHGHIMPIASNEVAFTVAGAGRIAGTGNGNPSSHEPDTGSQRAAFNGKCMVVVRSLDGHPGRIVLTASSPGLAPAHLSLVSQ